MTFEKPVFGALKNESDVEQKFLFPLLASDRPEGLGHDVSSIHTKTNIRKFLVGKGSDQKSYFTFHLLSNRCLNMTGI